MPSIDCGLNPTAVNEEKKGPGIAGLLFLLVSLMFYLLSFRIPERDPDESKD